MEARNLNRPDQEGRRVPETSTEFATPSRRETAILADAVPRDVGRGSTPSIRTCVGCRKQGRRDDLLRVVVANGELVPDLERKRPGRGAWVHPDITCFDAAVRRRSFERALRVPGPVNSDAVRSVIADRKWEADGHPMSALK